MNVIEFIDQVLLSEIKDITQHHAYLGFGLIAGGIEFLGALSDSYDFDEPNNSADRFNKAITSFFDSRYHPYADRENLFYLYKNLRCGMLHVIIPQNVLVLGDQNDKDKEHLKKCIFGGTERLFLRVEEFYDDFEKACNTVKGAIRDKSILDNADVRRSSDKKRNILALKNHLLLIG